MEHIDPGTLCDFNEEFPDVFLVDTRENALDSLETAAGFTSRPDKLKWKWIAIALHHALYSFCIAALEQGNRERHALHSKRHPGRKAHDGRWHENNRGRFKSRTVVRGKGPGYTITWDPTTEAFPRAPSTDGLWRPQSDPKLIDFWTALALVQDGVEAMGHSLLAKPLVLSEDEWSAIEWLTLAARNDFMHFVPSSIMYGVDGFKLRCLAVLRPIEFVALECGTILYDEPEQARRRIRAAGETVRNACK